MNTQKRTFLFFITFAFLTFMLSPARAQFVQQGSKLVGTGAVGTAYQGREVSISSDGNTAIVGGPIDNSNAGAVWVFTRSGGVWIQQGSKLVGTGGVGTPDQGNSVSISSDGNTAIVGGHSDNSFKGAAWVFTRSAGVWTQQGNKLVGTGTVGDAVQGSSVAISADGNTAIVGGHSDNNGKGAAWVFTRSGGVWTQQGSKLVGTGAVGTAYQGVSVSIASDGNTAIVGGLYTSNNEGAAWVFTRSGGVWAQQGSKLVGTGAVGSAYQGFSVSLSSDGNTAIVGGYGDNSDTGAAWVFTRSGGVWTQQGSKLVGTGTVGSARQGVSVSVSTDGNIAIVGGYSDSNEAGAAWVFTRSGGVWTQQGSKLVGTGAVGSARQGRSVSISSDGSTAIVGGDGDNNLAGAVWVYSSTGSITLRDGSSSHGIIPEKSFNFYKFNSDLSEILKGTLTTDAQGKVTLPNGWFSVGDTMKVEKVVKVEPATRHLAIDDTGYVVKIDNAQFNSGGSIRYDTLTGASNQDITVGHATFMYDLVISIEWDATQQYIDSLVLGMRYASNYLYDVTDGQAYLRKIFVYDDKQQWDKADMRIHARNVPKPEERSKVIEFPRQWRYPFLVSGRLSDPCHSSNSNNYRHRFVQSTDYRTISHELGHLLFDFLDEYYCGPTIPNEDCYTGYNFGFMDKYYEDDNEGSPVYTSEMSNAAQYQNGPGDNTWHWQQRGMSCWDYFESKRESTYNGVFTPITKPTERDFVPPGGYFAGPNSDLDAPNYNVGSLLIVDPHNASTGSAYDPLIGTFRFLNLSSVHDAWVRSTKPNYRFMIQGKTCKGEIRCMGVEPGDEISITTEANRHYFRKTIIVPPPSTSAFSNADTSIYLEPIYGNYEANLQLLVSANEVGNLLTMNFNKLFPTVSGCAVFTDFDSHQEYGVQVDSFTRIYSVSIADSMGDRGIVLLATVDDSLKPFDVWAQYSITSVPDSQQLTTVSDYSGLCLLYVDSINSGIQKIAILSTDFPSFTTGLDTSNHRLSQVYSISTYPVIFQMMGINSIKISYDDSYIGDQGKNDIAVFIWKDEKWSPISSEVDTSNKTITALISEGGTYAVFTKSEATQQVLDGWNMVSVPLVVPDYKKSILFPSAQSEAFAYKGSYVVKDTLENGIGYWLKYASAQAASIFGYPLTSDTIPVTNGWNMIGSISQSINTSSIVSIPGGMITSAFFGYNGSYFIADTIEPGKGYWVKTSQSDSLILSAASMSNPEARIRIVPTTELPPAPPMETNNATDLPMQYALEQSYPNPFNPITTIKYQLPVESKVTLKIYSVLGQEVKTLVNEIEDAGFKQVEWNSTTNLGSPLASGVYFYKIEAVSIADPTKSFNQVKKMLLIR